MMMDFSNITILCIGDVMLDRFYYGDVERISPEAPVPVLRLNHTKEMLGGAGNVTNNILSLGGKPILIGLLGEDNYAAVICDLLNKKEVDSKYLVCSNKRPTICKSRFIAANQQVIRADHESQRPIHDEEIKRLIKSIDQALPHANAIVLSDYGKGVCCDAVVRHTINKARDAGIPIFVDPKSNDFSHYQYATCITPNLKEASEAVGRPLKSDEEIEIAAKELLNITQGEAILITRSEKGMTLVERDKPTKTIPSRAREIFDVSGAGDTVIATLSLGVASGLSISESMQLANAAAGVVVAKIGTATASLSEVLAELEAQFIDDASDVIKPNILTHDQIYNQVTQWKKRKLVVGFTNGCFDILHPGHVTLLKNAKLHCDKLIVALNTDQSIRRLKGKERPINNLNARAQIIAALRYVDAVTAFDEDTPLKLVEALRPNVLIKGGDYQGKEVVGSEIVQKEGGRVILADLQIGFSTTNMIERIRQSNS